MKQYQVNRKRFIDIYNKYWLYMEKGYPELTHLDYWYMHFRLRGV